MVNFLLYNFARMFEDDPTEALSRCQALLEEPETAQIIRPGDIYATMIKELVAKERYKAVSLIVHFYYVDT